MSAMRGAGESGSGSILAVGIVAAVLALCSMLLPLAAVITAARQAAAAADAAALAGADVAVGIAPGYPCESAAAVASANGAAVTACYLDGLVVTVRVAVTVLALPVQSAATAGPPPDEGSAHLSGNG